MFIGLPAQDVPLEADYETGIRDGSRLQPHPGPYQDVCFDVCASLFPLSHLEHLRLQHVSDGCLTYAGQGFIKYLS